MSSDTIKVIALPYYQTKNSFAGTVLLNPVTGKAEHRGTGNSVLIDGIICVKIQPTRKQLEKIRDDITRFLAHENELDTVGC